MQFLTLIYTDPERLAELPAGEFDRLMRGCFEKADALRDAGCLLGSQQLEGHEAARTLRVMAWRGSPTARSPKPASSWRGST